MAIGMAPLFETLDTPLPDRVRVAIGFTSAGHGKAFKRIALGLGLVGPMRATTPGDTFLAASAPILSAAGSLLHARLDTGEQTTAPKKQAVRMLNASARLAATLSGLCANGSRRHSARSRGMGRCTMSLDSDGYDPGP